MSRDLKTLRQTLRQERCPQAVLERVYARANEERRLRQLPFHAPVRWALAAVALITVLSWPLSRLARQQPPAPHVAQAGLTESREIRQQTELALVYFGQTLQHAGNQSRDIILQASLPSLRQGLRTAREAMALTEPQNQPQEN